MIAVVSLVGAAYYVYGLVADSIARMRDAPVAESDPDDIEIEAALCADAQRRVDLIAALEEGLVTASPTGRGLDFVTLKLKSQVDYTIEVTITAGVTSFWCDDENTQDMIVTGDEQVCISAHADEEVYVSSACLEMEKHTPGESTTFRVVETRLLPQFDRSGTGYDHLSRVMALDQFQDAEMRVRQFTIWTITDNPSRERYPGISTYGQGSGPSEQELRAIIEMLIDAGIDPADYHAFQF